MQTSDHMRQRQHLEMKEWLLKRKKLSHDILVGSNISMIFLFIFWLLIFYIFFLGGIFCILVLKNVNMYKINNSNEESNLLYPISFSQKPKQKQTKNGPFDKRFLITLFKFCENICEWKSVWKYVLWYLNNRLPNRAKGSRV